MIFTASLLSIFPNAGNAMMLHMVIQKELEIGNGMKSGCMLADLIDVEKEKRYSLIYSVHICQK